MRNWPFKAELKFGYWSRMFLFLIEVFHIYHCRSNNLQHGLFVPSRSLEYQKEGAHLFHGTMISKFPHSLYRLYVEPMLYLDH